MRRSALVMLRSGTTVAGELLVMVRAIHREAAIESSAEAMRSAGSLVTWNWLRKRASRAALPAVCEAMTRAAQSAADAVGLGVSSTAIFGVDCITNRAAGHRG